MSYVLSLTQLLNLVQDAIDAQFFGQAFWVRCEVTDVKKYDAKNWCFCKLLEKKGGQVVAETPGVFWQQGYLHIRRFEQATGRKFENGIEISALANVKFHPKFGFKLEIIEIDLSFSLGQMELARQETIRRLLAAYPGVIRQEEDLFFTPNNQLPLPQIIQRVALITANHSDGQRDFIQELTNNAHGYPFRITGFYTTIQGETAPGLLVKQFEQVAQKAHLFDVVALVRGGGSQTDLKPFDDYELAKTIALFPVPVLTGIGHDRNTSIADLVARQYKVPTKVAATLVDHNLHAEQNLLDLKNRLEETVEAVLEEKRRHIEHRAQQMLWMLPNRIATRRQRLQLWEDSLLPLGKRILDSRNRKVADLQPRMELSLARFIKLQQEKLAMQTRLVDQVDPKTILQKGFAMIEQDGKILTDLSKVDQYKKLVTRMAKGQIESTIEKIQYHDGTNDI
jgi:exodeoxyribonuclease VII large subunit